MKSTRESYWYGQNLFKATLNLTYYIDLGFTNGQQRNWPRGYKIFSMLNSVEHEILNTYKYKNIK